jgi:hypothetical protein
MARKVTKRAVKPAKKAAVSRASKVAKPKFVTREEIEQYFGGLMTRAQIDRRIERSINRRDAQEDVDYIVAGNIFARSVGGAVASLVAMGMEPETVAENAVNYGDAVMAEIAKRAEARETAKTQKATEPVAETAEGEDALTDLSDNEPAGDDL